MSLTASPFDPTTGELLTVYRDAYLRDDLSAGHTKLVDAYLKKNATLGTQTWQRFHEMAQTGEQVQAVGWMERQLNLVRTSAGRTRRQAASLVAATVLIGGAVFAGTATPTTLAAALPLAEEAPAAATGAMRMMTVHGKILDENGRPLIGATVFEKSTHKAVSTNADGEYALLVAAGRPTTLAYGYGGYTDEEVQFNGRSVENVTLVPNYDAPTKPARKHKRWFFFN